MPFPGFIYWGLFAACGAVIAAYVLWMLAADRAETGDDGGVLPVPDVPETAEGGEDEGRGSEHGRSGERAT